MLVGPAIGQIFPQRVDGLSSAQPPFSSTGLLETQVGSSYFRGSGVVARDARLVFTCAHVAFDRGVWANGIRIAAGWNARSDAVNYQSLRGWRYFSSYASSALTDDASPETFSMDFLVGFRSEPIGPVVRVRERGAGYLTDTTSQKMIVGYPAERDFDGASGFFYMHQTGPFASAFYQEFGTYYGLNGVSTGSGNSGGPVFENSSGEWILAAILVSGSRNTLGVFAIDPAAWQISNRALEALGAPLFPDPSLQPGQPPEWSGGTNEPAYKPNELIALQRSLIDRIAQVRRIKNPKIRTIQMRRLRILLLQVNAQIVTQP